MSSVPDTAVPKRVTDRIRPFLWPVLAIAGVVIAGCSQATWGYSDQGAQLEVSGLGGVDAKAAATADVAAAFGAHTHRPALVTLILGVVIALVALLAWWKPIRRNRIAVLGAAAVIAAAGVATVVVAAVTVADPATHLFDAAVIDAIDTPGPLLDAGWGAIATLVLGLLTVVVALTAAVLQWPVLTNSRRDRTPVSARG
ncbi:hypothetical protein ACLQ3C_17215 [Gordonia sp. DT30]|uniref:hypothetical protein n=1 Tax=Gordonia sp. DT30 TaxID=3416546 RepID=UPI003CFB7404